MSNIYHTEPPTQGKVVLHTSFGDVDIELWPKEAPLACRNFIQLCLEGYYDGTVVNRIIKDFMVQLGDPTGTGTGGTSIWGRPFKDEVHGRIRFNHRGQVAMANENKPNTNQSQFFITLGACDWLDRKHTIFGKVTGNTFYNLSRLGEAETTEADRPVDKHVIRSVEVLWNPFDDIVPRNITKRADAGNEAIAAKPEKQREGKRDLKVLSFGDEEEEDAEVQSVAAKAGRGKSAFDARERESKSKSGTAVGSIKESADDSRENNSSDKSVARTEAVSAVPDEDVKSFEDRMKQRIREKQAALSSHRTATSSSTAAASAPVPERPAAPAHQYRERVEINNEGEDASGQALSADELRRRQLREEYEKLRAQAAGSRRAIKILTGEEAEKEKEEVSKQLLVTPLEQRRQRFIKRKRELGDRQSDTLARLNAFSSSLSRVKSSSAPNNIEGTGEPSSSSSMFSEAYSGQVLDRSDEEEGGEDGAWFAGKLKFRRHVDDDLRK